ncbi:two-component sensor histidine kinase [Paramagnetospirillum kuznetsovii]|uniref:Nitrogen regulation protein n=1 Tax=Paramagnetospirillum kuznetsovii TaxID=2053833 RepID=A0A364NZL8_9PROT|nr:PAS domain-containing sensor histidine kinase [Paramagnetospirillum kuznetsovii]RAU22532.1 two-component sensor histidine kinase [Paramagnetospirillum kuznetsovii]
MAAGRHQTAIRLRLWARRVDLPRILAYGLTFAAVPSVIATVWAMGVGGGGAPDPRTVLGLLLLDCVLLLALGGVVAYRVLGVLKARRQGSSGSKLHLRFIMLFALVAVTPSALMSVGSAAFFRYGVESWFSDKVRTALQASLEVAHAYLEEHKQIIGGDALAMANDINREGGMLLRSPQAFAQFVGTQAAIRGLSEAIVFDSRGTILARSGLIFAVEANIDQIPQWAYDKARGGDVAVMTGQGGDDRVRALVMLPGLFGETFLYVGRFVDPKVLGHMEQTSAAVAQYERLEGRRSGLETAFSLVFAVVALLLVLTSVWVGLSMATRLATPIARLIDAAERVRSGDLDARVAEDAADEVGVLSRAFNRMTHQLGSQRAELMEANRELDERRRFTETVLAGVSAGVIGLDREGRIHLPNRSASELVGRALDDSIGSDLRGVLPELAEALDEVVRRPDRLVQREVRLEIPGRSARILLVRVAGEHLDGEVIGYVVTFDDITELVSAQRKAAWADVARRIAHEIKNPLTPIQLSAERLKRKYLKEIHSDPETYVKLIETIVRQVEDIGRMVDEFSSFARMPAPQMKPADLADICRQAVFLQRTGAPDIQFVSTIPDNPVVTVCDGRLIGQALTNLLKNAVEGIQGRDAPDAPAGRITLILTAHADRTVVEVEDNGKGLPKENRERLTEPYVTTRAKGTGLGLAIVKKIMEDHGGDLYLEDAPEGGARVGLIFPAAEPPLQASDKATEIHGA